MMNTSKHKPRIGITVGALAGISLEIVMNILTYVGLAEK